MGKPQNAKLQRTRQQQKEIAEAALIQQLRRDIAFLNRTPNDFRDLVPGSVEWEHYANLTKRRKEMEDWSSGPMAYIHQLTDKERYYYRGVTFVDCTWFTWEPGNFEILCTRMRSGNISWLYLPEEDMSLVWALNTLFSRMKAPFRAKGQPMSESTGKPAGIVY